MSVLPSKTFRFKIQTRPKSGEWFNATQVLFNQVVEFYFNVIQGLPGILLFPDKDAMMALERYTHRTKDNPDPPVPFEFGVSIPAMFRRAAINSAIGSARSFHSNLVQWRKQKSKTEANGKVFRTRPPVPPRTWNKSPVLYAGQWKGFDNKSVLLRLWTGNAWAWIKFGLRGREIPVGWAFQSPGLVKTGRDWSLHVPAVKVEFRKPLKVEQQVKEQGFKVCSVDLNINDSLAVCCILRPDGTEEASRFIRGGRYLQHRRKRILGIIATKRKKTGLLQEGVQDNRKGFEKIRDIDEYEAHRVSRRIVEFAVLHGAKVLVFEHLGSFRPRKGRYSARGNEKRGYWLRGKIFRYSKYKAWEHGIICSRVSPAYTSRHCCRCGADVGRYTYSVDPAQPYQAGAPNFLCPACGLRGNSDHGAARNIALRLFERYGKPRSRDLGLSGSQEAGRPGSRDRWGTTSGRTGPLRSSGRDYVPSTAGTAYARLPKEVGG